MTRLRLGPDLTVPDDAVTQTFALFGKRGSGKSNTAVVLAEEMHKAGAPFVVLDPISAWWGLKSSFDGKGPGLPVYVFGGPHGDLPLQPAAGELMAQVFIRHRQPMVLDMKGWSGAERARFVTAFAEWLLGHNDRVPVHVFLEEADAFIPQRPFKGEERMLGAMDRLIRWGRQEGVGSTTITQRSAKINKDVTTQTEVLVAHRTTGPQDRDVIRDWIRFHAGDEEQLEILSTLPTLPDGTAWVWSPEWLGLLRQVAFRRRETFDSASTPKLGEKRVAPKELAAVDLDALRDQLAATIEQQKANDPAELRRRIVQLEREATARENMPRTIPAPERIVETVIERVEVPVLNGQVEHLEAIVGELRTVAEGVGRVGTALASVAEGIIAAIGRVNETPLAGQVERAPRGVPAGPPATAAIQRWQLAPAASRRAPAPVVAERAGEVRLKAGARRMLESLARLHPQALTRHQVATLSDISPTSGTFSDYLSAIRGAGLLLEEGHLLWLSPDGEFLMAGSLGIGAPTSGVLLEMWGRKLKAGARRMLGALHAAFPDGLTREQLADAAEITRTSGTFSDYLSMLRRNGLIEESGGMVRAGGALFLGGR